MKTPRLRQVRSLLRTILHQPEESGGQRLGFHNSYLLNMSLSKFVSSGSKQGRHWANVLGWTSVSSMSEWKDTDLRVLWFLICWKVSWDWVRKVGTECHEDKCVGIWGLLHTPMTHHSEGLFTATHTGLESFTVLPWRCWQHHLCPSACVQRLWVKVQ